MNVVEALILEIQEKLDQLAQHGVTCAAIVGNNDGSTRELNGRGDRPENRQRTLASAYLSLH